MKKEEDGTSKIDKKLLQGCGYQSNKISGKVYKGNNQICLLKEKEDKKYESNEWVTFLQAKELNLKVKKGSKGIAIFKGFGSFDRKTKSGKIVNESRPLGFARVFNIDQTEKVK